METLVKDYMTKDLVAVTSATTVDEAAARMRDDEVGVVLVVDDDALVGIVTDRDLAVRVVAEGLDPATTTSGSVATPAPVALDPEQPLAQAAEIMVEQAVRRLPVVKDGRPVGILSIGDLAVIHGDRVDGGTVDIDDTITRISAAEGPSTRQAGVAEGTPANMEGPTGDIRPV